MNNNDGWTKSPITGKNMVLQELDEKSGVSKMDLSSGMYTNEFPLNYKKNPNFNIEEYESLMPDIVKTLRYDDGESYWYPATIQTKECFVFPAGTVALHSGDKAVGKDKIKWCYAPVAEGVNDIMEGTDIESKVDMTKAEFFVEYLAACKKVKGFALGDI
tara:strand:- start:1762 stop:2241 length:480 start_codon:yes stop_codon:yes gene_type:complete